MGYHCIVVRTQPRRELWAAENVQRQGCDTYLPRHEVQSKARSSLKQVRAEVVFRSYLFVFPKDGQWRFLLGTFGVSSIIMRGDQPATVAEKYITEMRKREDGNGFLVLPKQHKFAENERVRIKDGPFLDKIGLYQGQTPSQRERVLLDILGGKVTITVGSDSLEAA